MSETIEITIPVIPGIRNIVLREKVHVSLNSASATVGVETVYPLIHHIAVPPQATSFCEKARIWTLSGSHMTRADGTVEIHLNKFLDCVPSVIKEVVPSTSDQPVVTGIVYSNFIGSRPNFTATPESEEAVFLTYTIDMRALQPPHGQVFLPQAWDVIVRIKSWKHDGTPAPNIEFDWIAATTVASVTNF